MSAPINDGRQSTFGKELMEYISSKLPYSNIDISQNIEILNPKYKFFKDTVVDRQEVLAKYSVTNSTDFNNQGIGNISADKRYSEIMYANIQKDKPARIRDYRIMAAFAEVGDALDEICDEIINVDDKGNVVNLTFRDIAISDFQKDIVIKEFSKYIQGFDLVHKGWAYFRQLLTEGEIYWEHIIHAKYPHEGILGINQIPTEMIDPIYSNVQNIMVKGFIYRKPKFDPNNPLKQIGIEYIPMDKNQVTYIHSGNWNENRTSRLPFLENARRAYRQLSFIEDAIVIYRLVRAPERLVFNVDVGNMPAPKAEAYLKKLIQSYWSSKTFDLEQNSTVQKFNPQSMLDSFWFAKRTGSEGTSVTQLAGGQNLGELTDLMYFVKKLYKALKVPTTRLDTQDAFRDGQEILREELKFAKFIIRMQQHFAQGLKNGFITHLQMKGIWRDLELKDQNIFLEFNVPTNFFELREAQKLELKVNNFNSVSSNESISKTYAQKKYLGWSDIEIGANREFLRKDKALEWELTQIMNMGPNWKEAMQQQAQGMGGTDPGMGGLGGAGGMSMGGMGGGGSGLPPEFGGEAAETGTGAPGAEASVGAPNPTTPAATPAATV